MFLELFFLTMHWTFSGLFSSWTLLSMIHGISNKNVLSHWDIFIDADASLQMCIAYINVHLLPKYKCALHSIRFLLSLLLLLYILCWSFEHFQGNFIARCILLVFFPLLLEYLNLTVNCCGTYWLCLPFSPGTLACSFCAFPAY